MRNERQQYPGNIFLMAYQQQLGGHAVMTVGYNDGPNVVNGIPPQYMVIRNSWGPGWGVKGYFFMPYAYMTNQDLADDFWVITMMNH